MSFLVVRWALRLPVKLPHAARVVLMVLADHADDDGTNCFPSLDTVTSLIRGTSRKSVIRSLETLRQAGVIKVDRRGGRKRPNQYRINVRFGAPYQERDSTPDLFPETVAPAYAPPRKKGVATAPENSVTMPQFPAETVSWWPENSVTMPPDSVRTQSKGGCEAAPAVQAPPVLRIVGEADPKFDEFWSLYPRKEAIARARVARAGAITRAGADTIIAGLRRFQFHPELSRRPHAATWLDGDRWADQQPDGLYTQRQGPAAPAPARRAMSTAERREALMIESALRVMQLRDGT